MYNVVIVFEIERYFIEELVFKRFIESYSKNDSEQNKTIMYYDSQNTLSMRILFLTSSLDRIRAFSQSDPSTACDPLRR